LNVPTGIAACGPDGAGLAVADAWNHRVLIWFQRPTRSHQRPDVVLGQAGFDQGESNRGADRPTASTLFWTYCVSWDGARLWVADTGNRRVLGWRNGIPEPDQPADVILGQSDAASHSENRDGPAGANSFRWPHDIAGYDDLLLVADAGDHRVLGWSPQPDADRDADLVVGQQNFTDSEEWPYGPHTNDRFRFPYAVCLDGGRLAVADTANNRILLWDGMPDGPIGRGAAHVLAQPDFASNGENRWTSVQHDTLCWPYGLSLHGDTLAVADSGNNRVMLWKRSP
jgi:hypothetical protein